MTTNWEELSKKLGVLKADGSESIAGNHSAQALEEILGDEWLRDTLDTFIDGRPGNELAIKTLRYIRSERVAKMAYALFTQNRNTDSQKARLAVWAMGDIRMPDCLDYVEECIGDEKYEGIAIGVLRNLIYENGFPYDVERLNSIFDKIKDEYQGEIAPLRDYVQQKYQPSKWYKLLGEIQKRPALYGIQKVEDIFLFYMGYSMSLSARGVTDEDLDDFSANFTKFVVEDYEAPAHCNWSTAIRLYSSSDNAGVELFFEELAKYKSGETEFDRIQYREDNKIFCCEEMAGEVKKSIGSDGAIMYDNADVIINKWGNGIYGIPVHDGGTSVIEINHCPWCGKKLK
jgi:hypothetical protein